jgi:hypothetical protein
MLRSPKARILATRMRVLLCLSNQERWYRLSAEFSWSKRKAFEQNNPR